MPPGAFREGAFGVGAGAIMPMMLMLLSAQITLRLLRSGSSSIAAAAAAESRTGWCSAEVFKCVCNYRPRTRGGKKIEWKQKVAGR